MDFLDAIVVDTKKHNRELCMTGKVKTRQKCRDCNSKFEERTVRHGNRPVIDMLCPRCGNRPDSFYICIYLSKEKAQGKKHQKFRITRNQNGDIFRSYAEANRILESIRKAMDEHDFNISHYICKEIKLFQGMTLFPKWFETKKDKAPSYRDKIKQYVDNYYVPFFREKDMRTIKTAVVEDFFMQIPSHLSDKTKQNIMNALHNFVSWFLTREEIAKVIKWPTISPAQPPIKWFSKEDQLKVYEHIHKRHQPIFWFMIWHPVRSMEAAALLVEDFDFQRGMVDINKSFSKNELRSRKNKRPYILPVSKRFPQSMLQGKFPKDFAFKNKYGNHYTNHSLEHILTAACKKAGLSHIKVKNFTRHSIASQAINSGQDLNKISKALGHSNMAVTRDRYACLEAESLRDLIDGATDNVIDIKDINEPGTNN